ncbi:hypothetical protein [Nonomuraea sp. NPDC003754]
MDRNGRNEGDILVQCMWCGTKVADGSELFSVAPDSSMVHASDPTWDGHRVLIACSPEHLAVLQEHYRRRPFVDEELWAGKLARALEGVDCTPPLAELTEATGLSLEQLQRCLAWIDTQLHRPHTN